MPGRLNRVMAYLDGELDAAARETFEAEMAADPALAAEVTAHRELAERLATAYGPVANEPVPLQLILAAEAANESPPRRFNLAWAGMAACLVIGVIAGRLTLPPTPRIGVGADVPARTDLARALDRQLAPQPGAVRIGLSFRDAGGRYCRTFQSRPDSLAGLACREGSAWQVRTATRWTPADTPTYRTAASDTPPEVLVAVDRTLTGDVLDAAQERAARDRDWR
jgi:hypothetical protein